MRLHTARWPVQNLLVLPAQVIHDAGMTRNARILFVLFLGAVFVLEARGLAQSEATPSLEWPRALPEEVGLDSAALSEMLDYVRQHEIPVHSVQIVRHGRLVLDAYFYPFSIEMRHDVASV